ncbi:MAG TPA: conjugative transposon protein TraJ [Puia sp.]|nr:conjugative transposon protein TraJ [Puia sp.]
MKKKRNVNISHGLLCLFVCFLMPYISTAQDRSEGFHGLQQVLENLYDQMIPLCSQLIGVGRALAGFAALWYIAARVWGHLSRAEPIDFYPLLRPFVVGFCIASFPMVLNLINGVLQPTVFATDAMVNNTNQALFAMLDGKEQVIDQSENPALNPENDPSQWYQYTHPDGASGSNSSGSNPIADAFSAFSFRNLIKTWIAEILEFFYKCAALCIDTIRTFKLIVLAILGPFAFGLSVFDGFQHTLRHWLARYINVFMWLPVANIFGAITAKIQLNMMQLEAAGGNTDPFFADTNTAYLIFLLIAIVGYFTVPSIAGYIVNVGGHALFNKTAALASTAVSAYTGMVVREGASTIASFQSFRNSQNAGSNAGSDAGEEGKNNYKTKKLTGET